MESIVKQYCGVAKLELIGCDASRDWSPLQIANQECTQLRVCGGWRLEGGRFRASYADSTWLTLRVSLLQPVERVGVGILKPWPHFQVLEVEGCNSNSLGSLDRCYFWRRSYPIFLLARHCQTSLRQSRKFRISLCHLLKCRLFSDWSRLHPK